MTKVNSKPPDQNETARLVQWGKENSAKLNSCKRHDFTRMEDHVFSQYRCLACGGVVTGPEARAYQLGIKHASKE